MASLSLVLKKAAGSVTGLRRFVVAPPTPVGVAGRRSLASSTSTTLSSSSWTSLFFDSSNKDNTVGTKVPRTFRDAMLEQKQAIVVTTSDAPFKILYVNEAWERMCGYTKNEVLDSTLECIQGADTNVKLADATVRQLVGDRPDKDVADMYLINYKKDGTPFTNHVTMGTMKVNSDPHTGNGVKLLVGVLEEVQPSQVPLRMMSV